MVAEVWYRSKDIPGIVDEFTDNGFVRLEKHCRKINGENTISSDNNVIRIWCKKSEIDKLEILDNNESIKLELNLGVEDYFYRVYYIR